MSGLITGLTTNVTNIDNVNHSIVLAYVLAAFLIIGLIFLFNYLYNALALFSIARKNNEEYPWFAFFPILNSYLLHSISRTPIWMFYVAIGFPILSGILRELSGTLNIILLLAPVPVFIESVWHGNVARQMNYSFWLGFLIPIFRAVSFVILLFGSLAFYFRDSFTEVPPNFVVLIRDVSYGIALLFYLISMIILGIIAWKTKMPKNHIIIP